MSCDESTTLAATIQSTERPGDLRILRTAAGVIFIALVCAASFWLALNPEMIARLGHWGYVGAFLISMVASATIVLPAPGIAIIIAMGGALDPVLLGIVAGLGSAVGELSGYLAGLGGRALISSEQRRWFNRLHDLTDRHGPLLLGFLAAIPFPLFDLAGIVAGAIRMRVASFLAAVAVGKSVKYVVLILLGAVPIQLLQQFFG